MQTQQLDQLVGKTLGEYRIERLLGHAQLGTLYLGRQLSQGRTVVVSTFNFPEGLSTVERNQLTSRLAGERAALTRLSHPYIVPIYDLGEQSGYLYLVTAFVRGSSLSQQLKQQLRFTPEQTLNALKQLGVGLDYTHSQGVMHGLLSLSDVLANSELSIQITGYGLRTLLEIQEYNHRTQSSSYLFNSHGALLGSPEYVSPEGLLGNPVDARSDIYALGVILFKLLSGTQPFNGSTPLESAMQRIQKSVPSLHTVCSDIPEAFDLVVSKALELDPVRRYQRAGDIAEDFERALNMLNATRSGNGATIQQLAQSPQFTLPPTINWFNEGNNPSNQWQLVPPVVTGHMPAVTPSASLPEKKGDETGNKQMVLPLTTAQPDALTEVLPTKTSGRPDSLAGVDPFAWWGAALDRSAAPAPAPGTFTRRAPRPNPRSRRYPARRDRRKLVTLIAGTAGALMVGGISLAHVAQSMKQSQVATTSTQGPATSTTQANTPAVGTTQGTQGTLTPSASPTAKASPSATHTAQPSPTSQPTQQPTPKPTQQPTQPLPPTPTPPPHTGTVIGHTSMPANSAASFTNPADGQASWLVHMSNGNFVAVEQACTHAGVPVKYNPATGQFNCPAHGAIFNADGTNPQAPATRPLPPVHITVNADGTITTG